jgi:putative colanic acid biosynthesis glycosyltransferase WcaI
VLSFLLPGAGLPQSCKVQKQWLSSPEGTIGRDGAHQMVCIPRRHGGTWRMRDGVRSKKSSLRVGLMRSDANMWVTLVCLNYPPEPTGIAPYTGGLAHGLAERGAAVRVVTGLPHYPRWQVFDGYRRGGTETRDGISVARRRHFVPFPPRLINRLAMELMFGLNALVASWKRPDVVVLVSPALFSSILCMLRARLTRRPVIVWVQDLYSLGAFETGSAGRMTSQLLALVERYLLNPADAVVVIHERFRRYVVGQLGIDREKVSVVRNWSHLKTIPDPLPEERLAMRRRLGWPDDVTVVLHAGNMGAKQGLANVVRASRLADQGNEPLLFVLMGDGNQRAELEAMGGNRCLQIIDPLPADLFPQALRAADALLVNERGGVTEMAVPSKLTSYFATGRPVIAATDLGSITADEIELSNGGTRVQAERPDLLVAAALELRDKPQLSAHLGANGRAFRNSSLIAEASINAFHEVLSKMATNQDARMNSRRRLRSTPGARKQSSD